jgi:hypothetical protein
MSVPPDPAHELRVLSDELVILIAEISVLEDEKRALDPGHPAFVGLARSVSDVAGEILRASIAEERVAENHKGSTGVARIVDQPLPDELKSLADEWYELREALRVATPGSDEARAIRLRASAIRDRFSRQVRGRVPG